MPPKKATRAAAATRSTAGSSTTTTPAATKRKATEEQADSAPKKRGRPAKAVQAADSKDTVNKSTAATRAKRVAPAKVTKAPAAAKTAKTTPVRAAKAAPAKATKAITAKATKAAAAKTIKAATTAKATKPAPTKSARAAKAAPAKSAKIPPSKVTKSSAKTAAAKAATAKKAGPKKAAPKKVAAHKASKATKTKSEADANGATITVPTANTSRKRKAANETTTSNKKARIVKRDPVINEVPTEVLDIYVFGAGDSGELGLGTAKNGVNVKRPRLNPLLAADKVGVVQIACGGMHGIAITRDNKILTWGVNDNGALGRDTAWDGGLRNIDEPEKEGSDSDSDADDDNGLNPRESIPTAIPSSAFPEGTTFVQVVAGDSLSLALTDDGHVWAWGTFRDNAGVLGFSSTVENQFTPVLVKELKKIKHIACGANHVLALDAVGNVFAWGTGQQNQLGRRVVERTRFAGLTPREFGLPKKQIEYISCGSDHSFAVDNKGSVWSWGLNNFGQCGIFDNAGDDDAVVPNPTKVPTLSDQKMVCLKGGRHHSVGVNEKGDLFAWGRFDAGQIGRKLADIDDDDLMKDEHGAIRLAKNPVQIKGIKATQATAESDHSLAIATDGKAYSWGFSGTYQTGQGTDDDIKEATLLDNTAVRGKKLTWAGAGGQYSMLAGIASVQGAPKAAAAATTTATKATASDGPNGTSKPTPKATTPAPTANNAARSKSPEKSTQAPARGTTPAPTTNHAAKSKSAEKTQPAKRATTPAPTAAEASHAKSPAKRATTPAPAAAATNASKSPAKKRATTPAPTAPAANLSQSPAKSAAKKATTPAPTAPDASKSKSPPKRATTPAATAADASKSKSPEKSPAKKHVQHHDAAAAA